MAKAKGMLGMKCFGASPECSPPPSTSCAAGHAQRLPPGADRRRARQRAQPPRAWA
jgi:hypothetical protein